MSEQQETVASDAAGTAGVAAASQQAQSSPNQETPSIADVVKAAAEKAQPSTDASTAAAGAVTDGTVEQKPAFTPNFKYKAFQKEKEIEEFWRPLIKDADSEKKVKDLFTRAEAFDDLKARFEGTNQEFSRVYNDYAALDADVRKVTSFLNKGDFDNFFDSIGVTHEKIFNWVAEKLAQEELPPQQKQALRAQQLERQRLYELEQENKTLDDQFQTQASQARAMQLDMILSRPEVSQAASAWDQRMGTIGAFRDLVVEEAQKVWYAQKRDMSVEEAVQHVMTKYGKLIDVGVVTPQASAQQAAHTQSPAPQAQAKPVIPAVQGRGTSPVKKSPKSLDDLRQMAKELGG